MNKNDKINKILEIFDSIRPYIQSDGGDLEFIELTDDGIVKIRLHGACIGCGLANVTVTNGIEQALLDEIDGIIGVELMQDNWY